MDNLFFNEKIDISFCLPVFNVEKYLKECIKSIVSQCQDNISYEILCIDDNSTDNSYHTLKDLQNNYPHIILYKNEENKGVSYTRNRLISLAKGKYIWFVDPDDMLYPNVVKLLYDEIEKNNENVILGNYINCDEDAKYEEFETIHNYYYEVITMEKVMLHRVH